MGHYKTNLRDVEFNLFEVFDRQRVFGTAPFSELDSETVREILRAVERLATGPIAASYAEADRHPPVFDPAEGSVAVPKCFAESYRTWMDSGYYLLDLAPEFGGQGAPPSLRWAVTEMVQGANPAVRMFSMGPWFAQLLARIGTTEQQRFAELAIAGEWASTMVLTEADAGSDVGAGRTKAIAQPDGTWHIEGVKRFISGAEHDLADNIFHFVLARPEGAVGGTKGLSMFLVPKYLVDLETGRLGARNGVYATNLEKKMGLKASPTCELVFGANHPAIGYLVGDVHEGIKQMFLVMENARMSVGTKAVGALSTGYLNALGYAKSRAQGSDMTLRSDKTAPKVAIIRHPDVRRSLMTQKAYAEGLRALIMLAASYQDEIETARHNHRDASDISSVNDLLLPVIKAFSSERAYELLSMESLQNLGGSGFLQDYPLEQYVRDTKIDSLYEGTTGIQGIDLFFRKIDRDNGTALNLVLAEVERTSAAGGGRLDAERTQLDRAVADVRSIVDALRRWSTESAERPESIYKVGLNTSRLLMCLGDLLVGWLLVRQAEVALAALDRGDVAENFYLGKVGAARFFCATVLPRLAADAAIVLNTSTELMELPDGAF
jgi:alkylation response protein AidB-like acyl-CoA dehydrogenase